MTINTYSRKLSLLPALALLWMTACSAPESALPAITQGEGLTLLGSTESLRATQETFDSGDQIGVFALTPGSSVTLPGASNVPYLSDATGLFKGQNGQGIKLQGAGADIAAYYPYNASANGTTVPFDLSDQSDASLVDLLWGKVPADRVTSTRVPVVFDHLLGLVEITFVPKDVAHPLPSAIEVTAKSLLTEGTLDVTTGVLSKGSVRKDVILTPDASNKVYLMMIPGETLTTLSFRFDGKTVEYTLPAPIAIKKGTKATLTLRPYGEAVAQTTAYAEIPLVTAEIPGTHQAIHYTPDSYFGGGTTSGGLRRNYTILYDENKRQPLWVAYPMYADCTGSADRTNAWDYDPDLPRNIQPVLEGSYQPQSMGFNRGHMLGSAGRNATSNLNRSTFYYTNMVPQNSGQNSGIWNQIETLEQKSWGTSNTDTLYVVCGPIFTDAARRFVKDDLGKNVRVPDAIFKVLLRKVSGEWLSMAVRMPNVTPPKGDSWKNHMVTVKSLEEELGFTFFTHLPADIADEVKSQNNPSQWN